MLVQRVFQATAVLAMSAAAAAQPAADTSETYLTCEGEMVNVLTGAKVKSISPVTIARADGKVVSVSTEKNKFTLDKVDVAKPSNKGPVYVQLIVEPEKIILRMEVKETGTTADTVIENSGAYSERRMFGIVYGRCAKSEKLF